VKTLALILAGGTSERLGFPKPFLEISGETICERLSRIYNDSGIDDVAVVLNSGLISDQFGNEISKISKYARIVENSFPEKGRSFSIRLGLGDSEEIQACFIHNVDNPGLSKMIVSSMLGAIASDSYVVPIYHDKSGHTVLLGKNPYQHIRNLQGYDWILRDELKKFRRIETDAGTDEVLCNINTIDEWNIFLRRKLNED
jgi:CTP:molybdopterin cytidylyltransferase MocA